jgi:hypothetical protein
MHDTAIARKVHDHLRFPFPFNSTLLSLPLQLHGFDFPSVARLNDCAAVAGLLRDLNHHLPLFSDMAPITLADWTCSVSHCQPPLLASSPSFERSYARFIHTLPRAWTVAHSVLRDLHLSIPDTDLS